MIIYVIQYKGDNVCNIVYIMYTGGTGADDGRHAIHGQQYKMCHDSDDDSNDDDDDHEDQDHDEMIMVVRRMLMMMMV